MDARSGITVFSTPFDKTALDLLEELGAPAYKIASFEMIDLPLVRLVASTGKPTIISTGMASPEEIGETVDAFRAAGGSELALLHCVSGYPTPVDQANIRRIPELSEQFACPIGLSDHTLGIEVAIASVALGASIIEKHFIRSRAEGGLEFGVLARARRVQGAGARGQISLCRTRDRHRDSVGG